MGEELRLYGEVVGATAAPVKAVTDGDRERAIGWLRHHLADVGINPGLPVLRVRALVLFGGLDVRTKKAQRPRGG